MNQPADDNAASGLLHALDDIRSLLERPAGTTPAARADRPTAPDALDSSDSAIPVLSDALPANEALTPRPLGALMIDPARRSAAAASDGSPPDERSRAASAPDLPEPTRPTEQRSVEDETLTERLIGLGLDAAIRARIDATLDDWMNETLQLEIALLRARLQDVVRTAIEAFVTQEIQRSTATGKTHGE